MRCVHHGPVGSSGYHSSGGQLLRSTTLPAGVQLGSGGESCCQESSSFHHHHHHHHSNHHNHSHQQCSQLWSFSARTIILLALSLVFILIWSSVISSVLLTNSYKEQESAQQMVDLFVLHKDIAHLAFTVGDEMLYTLNSSLTLETKSQGDVNQTQVSANEVRAKWNETDQVLAVVSTELARQGFTEFESLAREKLDTLRLRCVDYLAGVNLSRTAFADCARAFDRLFYSFDLMLVRDNQWLTERHSKLTVADLTIRDMPYTLFVRGMIHRFTALGLGLILTRFGTPDPSLNVSEYLHYHYSSRQQIESSFLWNTRFFQKYMELERSEQQSDMLLEQIDASVVHRWQMADLVSHIFTRDSLDRLRSYIKKKNVESVELLLLGGEGRTKFVTVEQESHRVPLQLNAQLFDSFGIEQIEQLVEENHFVLSQRQNDSQRYDQHVRQQVRFLMRMQDFLNVSIYSHLAQMQANEEQSFIYHIVVASILVLSVLFCLALACFAYLFCARRHSACFMETGKSILSRSRVGRRNHFWNPSTYFSASNHQQVVPKQGHSGSKHHCQQSLVFPCPASPNAFLVSSTSKRTFAGGVINRYLATPVGGSSSSSTKTALLTYKFENSRQKTVETTSLMGPDHRSSGANGPTTVRLDNVAELDVDTRCCCCCNAIARGPLPVKPSPKNKSPKQSSSGESRKNKDQDPTETRNATASSANKASSANGTM